MQCKKTSEAEHQRGRIQESRRKKEKAGHGRSRKVGWWVWGVGVGGHHHDRTCERNWNVFKKHDKLRQEPNCQTTGCQTARAAHVGHLALTRHTHNILCVCAWNSRSLFCHLARRYRDNRPRGTHNHFTCLHIVADYDPYTSCVSGCC